MTDPEKDMRRCANGPFYFAGLLAGGILLAIVGGLLIWWVLQCP